MNIILFPIKTINWLLTYTVFSIINFFYPIKDLLFNKYMQYSTNSTFWSMFNNSILSNMER